MKKFIIVLGMLFLGACLFAETYKIVEVIGTVNYEVSKGKFSPVKVGDEFEASTFIKTALNSSVKVEYDGKTYTIKAKQANTIDVLFTMAAPSKVGLKKQTIAKSDATDYAIGAREGVATASSRASEAKEDYAWDE